ncbi:TRAP transporter large permease subunit [Pseudaquabacterium rugosum]|uniref:TRAP transporter large permease subunit n=1 Tax=Pseudaquabacterium rugosum TaxID=2984194 RepID=A0ABU9BGG3_9BURK
MGAPSATGWRAALADADRGLAVAALLGMLLIPLLEIALRPLHGSGVENAPVLVQHLGLLMAMAGALAAARHGHLTRLGGEADPLAGGPDGTRRGQRLRARVRGTVARAAGGLACGALAWAAWLFVDSERAAAQPLAYGVPVWWLQAAMPAGFALLGLRLAGHGLQTLVWPLAGAWAAHALDGQLLPQIPGLLLTLAALLAGAPIAVAMGLLALTLSLGQGLPLASIPLSHYQITVNPSLPALPLFTLAGVVLARSGAAARLGTVFVAVFGGGVRGTVVASAALCSAFTALTGGSGVTILALGGLLLPLLVRAGYPQPRGIGLVTSASALGVLLAPSVPLIMVAVIARVPIHTMFLAGLLPALVMVVSLLLLGGFLRGTAAPAARHPPRTAGHTQVTVPATTGSAPGRAVQWPAGPTPATEAPEVPRLATALRAAWLELLTPLVALGTLASGLATPTESAAATAGWALLSQGLLRRELGLRATLRAVADSAMIIGGVMLIMGLALAMTNVLIDAGIPDALAEGVRAQVPDRHVFLLLLCLFLFAAAALMEIFAAIVVLVPLLLPLASAYGIDPVHFGILFLAAMEVGFLCPPAGMNLYFAAAMFRRPIAEVARAVAPALLAIFVGTLLIAWVPGLSTALPQALLNR